MYKSVHVSFIAYNKFEKRLKFIIILNIITLPYGKDLTAYLLKKIIIDS